MLEKQEKTVEKGKAFPSLFTDLSTLQSQVHMISVQNFIKLTSNLFLQVYQRNKINTLYISLEKNAI